MTPLKNLSIEEMKELEKVGWKVEKRRVYHG